MLDVHAAGHGFFARRGRPLVIGHRGVRRAGVAENTLEAFETAIRDGAEAVELDVRVCASGELVVLHDPTLGRVSGGADDRAAVDLTLTETSPASLCRAGRACPRSRRCWPSRAGAACPSTWS